MKIRPLTPLPLALAVAWTLLVLGSTDPRLSAADGPPQSTEVAVRVLYPLNGSIVTSSPVLIMILGPDQAEQPSFQLDGQALPLEQIRFAEAWADVLPSIPSSAGGDHLPLRSPLLEDKTGKAVWVTAVDLPDGEHVVALAGEALTAFSSRRPKEADDRTWEEPVLRVHGSPASRAEALDCGQCHQAEKPRVLGPAPVPETCHSCHSDVDLSLAHEHVMEFLAKCQMCHDPHAARGPSLLIDTRQAVCGLCHESGYAR